MRILAGITLAWWVVAGAAGVTIAAEAAESKVQAQKYAFNIPRQSLGSALKDFSKQTGLQVARFSDSVDGSATVGPVSGSLSAEEALRSLLAPRGLSFKKVNDRTIVVINPAEPVVISASEPASGATEGVEEMLVEGERDKPAPFSTANIDLTRTEDDVLPFTTFTARDIQLSGAANLEDFLRARLPQNFSAVRPEEAITSVLGISFVSVTNEVNFRGWGAQETVFLVNGRRLPTRHDSGQVETGARAGDFRGIPLGSIERVEILSSAGSVIYGEGATGGVINIITRSDYQGGQLTMNFETPWKGDASKNSVDLNYAVPLRYGFNLRVAGGYGENDPLHVADRAAVMAERWRRLIMQRAPALIAAPDVAPPMGSTTNIHAALFYTPSPGTGTYSDPTGTPLFGAGTSSFTSVPAGYTGGQGLMPFLSRQGIYNLGLAEGAAHSIYSKASRRGYIGELANFSIGIDKSLGRHWQLAADYSYSGNEQSGEGTYWVYASLNGLLVPASAASNPFGQDVLVQFDDPRMQRPEVGKSRTWLATNQLAVSMRGGYGDWRFLLDLSFSHSRDETEFSTFHSPLGGWTQALLSGAYNPFVDMRVAAPAAPALYDEFVMAQLLGDGGTRNYLASTKVSGPLLNLPAGALLVTAGAEWMRLDRYNSGARVGYVNSRTQILEPLPPFAVSISDYRGLGGLESATQIFMFDTYSAYAEATVPLVSPRQSIPLMQKVELFASGRLSHQIRNGFISAGVPVEYKTDPYLHAAGLRYDMLEGLAWRASRSIGFKPPSLSQVTPSLQSLSNQNYTDPRRNNQQGSLGPSMRITGGNPDLKPETTESTNFGLILQPRWIEGLRLTADYVESLRNDAIASTGVQEMINLEGDNLGRVQRAAPEPGAPNGVGRVIFVDARNINFRQIASRSMDISLDYTRADVFGGHLGFAFIGTKNLSFGVQTSNISRPVEQVRNRAITDLARQMQWNANAQLQWQGQRWTFGWSTRYFDKLLATSANRVAQGSDRAPWELEHDVLAGYQYPDNERSHLLGQLLSGTSITLGIKNVFDREPRFWAASSGAGYLTYDSIMGRSVWLKIGKSFGH